MRWFLAQDAYFSAYNIGQTNLHLNLLPISTIIIVLSGILQMQQILQELQLGTHEVVKDNQDGTLEMRVKPPSALQMRAGRVIVQIINERDQVVNANVQLQAHLQQASKEIEALKQQIKDLNDRLNSSTVPSAQPETSNPSDTGVDSVGKTETSGSEAS